MKNFEVTFVWPITKGWRNWHSAPVYTKEQIAKWNAELNAKIAKQPAKRDVRRKAVQRQGDVALAAACRSLAIPR
jgi:hypothetical protein